MARVCSVHPADRYEPNGERSFGRVIWTRVKRQDRKPAPMERAAVARLEAAWLVLSHHAADRMALLENV